MKTSIHKVMNAVRAGASLFIFFLSLVPAGALGEAVDGELRQAIRGVVTDAASGEAVAFASVVLAEDEEGRATVSDTDGAFRLDGVPLGRHTVVVTFVGYEPAMVKEVMVSSTKEVYLEIALKESVKMLDEIVVRPHINKEHPLNSMATTGARMLSGEEASRYAGGMDDPARLASAFAGVSADGNSNGISIHGNAPHLLSWRMEGVEIPNPNHFADISILGGGVLSSLSSHVLGNSDFLTGAFPAEYSNAVSGVFDVKLREGSNQNYEHTAQVGTLGFDFASEGPLGKERGLASYIVNYRYSALGFAQRTGLMSMDDETIDYQDLNLKLHLPAGKAGTFAVWMTGLIDHYAMENSDTSQWKSKIDENYSASKQYMVAAGIGHSYFFPHGGQLRTTLAATYFKEHAYVDFYNERIEHDIPWLDMNRNFSNLIAEVAYSHKFSARFTNKSGLNYTRLFYTMDMAKSPHIGGALLPVYDGDGSAGLLTAYSSNAFRINNKVTLNFGLNAQYLTLNDSWTLEPRLGLKWQPTARAAIAAAYGMHSRMEKVDVYFVEANGRFVNKELDFTKAHHFMLSCGLKLSENTNLKIEPFYQYLYDVPVEADGSYSVLNRSDFYVDKALVNEGKGRNYGVDLTVERYLSRGWYAMLTGSLFNSRYSGGDGRWHQTRYDRGFVLNTLGGKEWMLGKRKQNVLGLNLRLTLQGGDRYSPVDLEATLADPDNDVQYDESRAYSRQFEPMFLAGFTASYKMNRKKVSHEFALKLINATHTESYIGHLYNYHTKEIEPYKTTLSIPNILYKIEF